MAPSSILVRCYFGLEFDSSPLNVMFPYVCNLLCSCSPTVPLFSANRYYFLPQGLRNVPWASLNFDLSGQISMPVWARDSTPERYAEGGFEKREDVTQCWELGSRKRAEGRNSQLPLAADTVGK